MRFLPITLLISVVAHGCGGDAAVSSSEDAVIGGRIDRRHHAVGEVGVASPDDGEDVAWICSGTLVAPSTVLTAAHCIVGADGRRATSRSLHFATDGEVSGVRWRWIASDYAPGSRGAWDDLALLILSEPSSTEPIAIAGAEPAESSPAWVLGYGITRGNDATGRTAGTRRRARIELGAIAARELAYANEGHGACFGDSGGPLLQDLGDGEVVIGVTSRGTASDCSGVDIATRVDAFADWIKARTR